MLYRTKVEYGDWAMNHVQGCAHGCTYPCYAFLMAKRFGRVKTYYEWLRPFLVDNTIELLEKELPRYRAQIKRVQLCFTTDPYMVGYPEIGSMSTSAIELINSFDVPCVVLTKGILPDALKLLPKSKLNTYGITLVSLNEEYRQIAEPGAAGYVERIKALKKLHDAGLKTWVSIEPYPTPDLCNQDLPSLLSAVSFVDEIVFGRTHYSKNSYARANEYYQRAAETVLHFCSINAIKCHIKKGTAD